MVARCGYMARWLAGAVVVAGLVALVVGAWWPRGRAPVRAALSVTETLSGADTAGYARAYAPRRFVFPADWGAHPHFRNEWWYFTGTLHGASGRRFGVELTFFRTAVEPRAPHLRSPWATNQVYMAHLAVTDEAGKQFYAFDRFERGALGLAGARTDPFKVWVQDWVLESTDSTEDAARQPALDTAAGPTKGSLPAPVSPSPRHPVSPSGRGHEGGGTWRAAFPLRLRAGVGNGSGVVAVDLTAGPGDGLVLQGDSGLSRKGAAPGNASYYYSLPRMPVRGRLIVGGDTVVGTGAGWLDREWSTSALGSALAGWDWFGLRLDDGRDLMVYRLRRKDGAVDPYSAGVLVGADGRVRRLSADDVRLDVLDRWTSATTGVRYPSRWRLRVPAAGLDLEVTPWLAQQELNVTFRYWEGAVDVRAWGGGKPIGRGYVELTGYGASEHANVPIRR
ncbi:MAG: lipocalin-like domain-containing protein [Gemmatimonadota bacterium]